MKLTRGDEREEKVFFQNEPNNPIRINKISGFFWVRLALIG